MSNSQHPKQSTITDSTGKQFTVVTNKKTKDKYFVATCTRSSGNKFNVRFRILPPDADLELLITEERLAIFTGKKGKVTDVELMELTKIVEPEAIAYLENEKLEEDNVNSSSYSQRKKTPKFRKKLSMRLVKSKAS